MLLVIGDHPLTPWEKIAIIFLGGSIVMITMLIVACIVFPTCALFKWLNRGKFFETYFFIFHSTCYWEQLLFFYVETQLIRLIRETKKKSSKFFNFYVRVIQYSLFCIHNYKFYITSVCIQVYILYCDILQKLCTQKRFSY